MKVSELAGKYASLLEPLRSAVQQRDRIIEQLKANIEAERCIKALAPINRKVAYALVQLRLDDRACKRLISKGFLGKGEALKALEQDKTPEGVFLFNYITIFSDAIQDIAPRIRNLSRLVRNQSKRTSIEDVLRFESEISAELQKLDRIINENYRNQFVTLARIEAPESKEAKDIQRQQATFWVVIKIIAVLEIYLNAIAREPTKATPDSVIHLFGTSFTVLEDNGKARRVSFTEKWASVADAERGIEKFNVAYWQSTIANEQRTEILQPIVIDICNSIKGYENSHTTLDDCTDYAVQYLTSRIVDYNEFKQEMQHKGISTFNYVDGVLLYGCEGGLLNGRKVYLSPRFLGMPPLKVLGYTKGKLDPTIKGISTMLGIPSEDEDLLKNTEHLWLKNGFASLYVQMQNLAAKEWYAFDHLRENSGQRQSYLLTVRKLHRNYYPNEKVGNRWVNEYFEHYDLLLDEAYSAAKSFVKKIQTYKNK